MRISFITTVLNEEKTIEKLLISLTQQTRKPDEIIICDGGSSDKTVEIVENYIRRHAEFSSASLRILKQVQDDKGQVQNDGRRINRAKGRNEAIRQATGEIIAMSDAGCELEKRWVEEITKPFDDESFTRPPLADRSTTLRLRGAARAWPSIRDDGGEVDVVAGYYKVNKEADVFQRCVACYALVMPDKVDQENFLPASRSMAMRKSVWEKFGGFPEDFSDNEDYVFANRLKEGKASIIFNKEAIVYWQPVSNLKDFFTMIFRFAGGDAKAGLRRKKVATVFGRYAIGGAIGLISPISLIWLIFIYFGWAIFKNYKHSFSSNKYVRNWKAFIYLPVLQVTADIAIMIGIMRGMRLLRFVRNDEKL